MVSGYFLTNAVLYFGLAVFCIAKPALTSRTIGFVNLTTSGRSEYLAVYGGLQLGLALFYLILSREPLYYPIGLIFSLLLYTPIVVCRLTSLLVYRPNRAVTIATAALEICLLLWAVVVWRKFGA